MTDELGRKLEAISERVPQGTPDLSSVLEGGRRVKRRRTIAGTAGIVGLISLGTLAALNLDFKSGEPEPVQPATHEDGVFVPAERGDSTYALTNFRVEYPWAEVDGLPGFEPGSEKRDLYCDMPSRQTSCESKGNAGFFYGWRWATDRFPGVVACHVELFSDRGREVGHGDWELSGLEPTSRRPSNILVHVTAEPTRAEASCEAGTLEPGPTHRFTFIRAETYNTNPRPNAEPAYRNRLYFKVETLTEHSTGMCRFTVRYESGKKITTSFTMTGAPREGELSEMGAPYREDDPVADAEVRCRLYKREAGG